MASSRSTDTAESSTDRGASPLPGLRSPSVGGVAGGLTGTALATAALLGVTRYYDLEVAVFRTLAELAGVGGDPLAGVAVFALAGVLAWPLLFVTVGAYLPGATRPRKGVVFGLVLWTGFFAAFSGSTVGVGATVFLWASLGAHAGYGLALGAVTAAVAGPGVDPGPDV